MPLPACLFILPFPTHSCPYAPSPHLTTPTPHTCRQEELALVCLVTYALAYPSLCFIYLQEENFAPPPTYISSLTSAPCLLPCHLLLIYTYACMLVVPCYLPAAADSNTAHINRHLIQTHFAPGPTREEMVLEKKSCHSWTTTTPWLWHGSACTLPCLPAAVYFMNMQHDSSFLSYVCVYSLASCGWFFSVVFFLFFSLFSFSPCLFLLSPLPSSSFPNCPSLFSNVFSVCALFAAEKSKEEEEEDRHVGEGKEEERGGEEGERGRRRRGGGGGKGPLYI